MKQESERKVKLCFFSKLALGTRFRYNTTDSTIRKRLWVKIGANTIAEWDESQKTDNWTGQRICCFTETCDTDIDVIVL